MMAPAESPGGPPIPPAAGRATWAAGGALVFDGTNGWAIDGDVNPDDDAQDRAHAEALYDLLEHDVVPTFYDRDQWGVPHRWVAMAKRSLATLGPRVAALRMLRAYVETIYAQ
jgi:starch phosphorylase